MFNVSALKESHCPTSNNNALLKIREGWPATMMNPAKHALNEVNKR